MCPVKYPQGAEKLVISAILGREVPSGGLPADVHAICVNVATTAEIGRLLPKGRGIQERVITIGGPGVNQVAGYYVADLPTVWEDANRSFVQAELDGGLKRVALWGSDARATAAAVDAFVTDGHLEALLERIWRLRSDLVM